ncbi:MAG TPA: 5'/3'-nucleotidase SurE [Acidimicrobiales bacterium]|nr:5'/3'-nucleotidase SurE [Acidimicrobiales bacterium]
MRVLVTNDDGIHARGLEELAAVLDDHGHDVVVVAPIEDCSGCGAAIGPIHLTGQLAFKEVMVGDLGHVPAYAIDGPPALGVLAACQGGFGIPPALVVSGINAGANTGAAILHSGTVGAALTAAQLGLPAVAVSLALGPEPAWRTAATVSGSIVDWLGAVRGVDRPVMLNVNVPNLALRWLRGVRIGTVASGGIAQAGFVPAAGGHLQLEMTSPGTPPSADSDTGLVSAGYVAVTELLGVRGHHDAKLGLLPAQIEDAIQQTFHCLSP